MKSPSTILGLAAVAMTLLASAPNANATFVLGTGNVGNLGDNVIVNNCTGNTLGPAAGVSGCLNTSHTTLVDVSTTGGGKLTANGGQARFDASGGDINNFAINFDSATLGFTGIVFNINGENKTTSTLSFTVNAVDKNGNVEAAQLFSNSLAGNGNNFFNLISSDGEVATKVSVTSSLSNIVNIAQVRIASATVPTCPTNQTCGGGGPGPGVPEPASLFLLGSALLGFGAVRRRRRA